MIKEPRFTSDIIFNVDDLRHSRLDNKEISLKRWPFTKTGLPIRMLNPLLKPGPWLDRIAWNEQGLVPVIAQEASSGDVLMMAWMNQASLMQTLQKGEAVYWSRSRNKLWHKGEESGHTQTVREIRLDCDGDTLLLIVDQKDGIACHTGRHSCFFNEWDSVASNWVDTMKP